MPNAILTIETQNGFATFHGATRETMLDLFDAFNGRVIFAHLVVTDALTVLSRETYNGDVWHIIHPTATPRCGDR